MDRVVTLFETSYLLLWILAIVLIPISVVLVYLLALLGEQSKREGSGYGNNLIGRPLPTFAAVDIGSGAIREIDQFSGRVHVVLAMSPDCNSCRSLMKELSSTPRSDLAEVDLLVLCMGELEGCSDAVAELHAVPVYALNVRDDSTADLWFVGFPAALVIDESGIVVDVRHPLSISGVVAAVSKATISGAYGTEKLRGAEV